MSNADWDHEGQDTDSSLEDNFADRFVDEILSSRGGEFFCEVDEDYITDRFNLTGLSNEVDHFQIAYELVTDTWEDEGGTKELNIVHENSAKLLYGLIHARYILTPRGLQKMLEKYKQGDFGVCPRYLCNQQHLLPIGESDQPTVKSVQVYCPNCEDIYTPKASRFAKVDGAFFGPTFPHMLLQLNSALLREKSTVRYEPKIFGFRVHHYSNIHKRQDAMREEMTRRLAQSST